MTNEDDKDYSDNAVCNECGLTFHHDEEFELDYCPHCESDEVELQ